MTLRQLGEFPRVQYLDYQHGYRLASDPAGKWVAVTQPYASNRIVLMPIGESPLLVRTIDNPRRANLFDTELDELGVDSNPIVSMAFLKPHPQNGLQTLFSDSAGNIVVSKGPLYDQFLQQSHVAQPLAVSPGKKLIAVAGANQIDIYWTDSKQLARQLLLSAAQPHSDSARVTQLAFGARGRSLVSVAQNGSVRNWNLSGLAAQPSPRWQFSSQAFPAHKSPVTAFGLSNPPSKIIALGFHDGTARIINLSSHRTLELGLTGTPAITSLDFSKDADRLVLSRENGRAEMINTKTGKMPTQIDAEAYGPISQVFFIKQGSKILAAHWDGNLRVWTPRDTTRGRHEAHLTQTITGDSSPISETIILPGGAIVTVSTQGRIGTYHTHAVSPK